MASVFVSIGSSKDRHRSVAAGLTSLTEAFGRLAISPVFESEAVGFNGPAFLNLAVGFETDLPVLSLIEQLKHIEVRHGRTRCASPPGAHTLDLDLLTYGRVSGVLDGIILPRPELTMHAFTLWPLAELAPDVRCPGTQLSFAQLWQQWDGQQALAPVLFYWQGQVISSGQTRFGYSSLAVNHE